MMRVQRFDVRGCVAAVTLALLFAAGARAQEFIPEPGIIYYGNVPAGNVVKFQRTGGAAAGDLLASNSSGPNGYVARVELVWPVSQPPPTAPDGNAYAGTNATVLVNAVAQGQVVLDERGAIYQLDFPNPALTPSPNAMLSPVRILPTIQTPVSCGESTCTPTATRTATGTATQSLTSTPMPTVTPTPTGAALIGSVVLEGRPAPPHARWRAPLTVSLTRPGDGTPTYEFNVTTDDEGKFKLFGIVPDTYEIRVKNPQALQAKLTATLGLGPNVIDFGTLRTGDADDDNLVSLVDFSILRTTFGLGTGQAGYDPRADFNADALVSLMDFSLMRPNFAQLGASSSEAPVRSSEDAEAVFDASERSAAVVAPETAVAAGETFEVSVELRMGSQPVDGGAAYVNYDPAVLEVVDVSPGSGLPAEIQNRFDTPGQIDFAAGAFANFPSGRFTLVTIQFRAKTDADGTEITLGNSLPRQTQATFAGTSLLETLAGTVVGGGALPEEPVGVEDDSPEGAGDAETPTPTPTPTGGSGKAAGVRSGGANASGGAGCQVAAGGGGLAAWVAGLALVALRGRRRRG